MNHVVKCALLLIALLPVGCSDPPLPTVPPADPDAEDHGYPIIPRPACTSEVTSAAKSVDPLEIARLAAAGGQFTCGGSDDPLPLDLAVFNDSLPAVRALLRAGADPNARWNPRGDRFAFQTALEAASYSAGGHRVPMIQLMLRHGADPNARWCLFESRGAWADGVPPCVSQSGITPLMYAAGIDDLPVMQLLLDAGADPMLEDQLGANALDYAAGEGSLFLLVSVLFPEGNGRNARALDYLNHRERTGLPAGPWAQTPLASAIVRGLMQEPPSPPPPGGTARRGPSRSAGRVRGLLTLGVDPNQRLTAVSVDWTPLALAVAKNDVHAAEALLTYGADPNARWCVPVTFGGFSGLKGRASPAAGCTGGTGMTALMQAAASGHDDVVMMLLKHGGDPALADWNGATAHGYALQAKHPATARLLAGYRQR